MGCGASTAASKGGPPSPAVHPSAAGPAKRGSGASEGLSTGVSGLQTGLSELHEPVGKRSSGATAGQRPSLFIDVECANGGAGAGGAARLSVPPRSPASLNTPEPGSPTAADVDAATPRAGAERKAREWEAYLARQERQEAELRELCASTRKRAAPPLPPSVRVIRPFLSSTFRDFNNERNVMARETFPRLERLCNERGVSFTPLDLRWGVTSEQSGSGQVIKICLEEIDRCRPFFVGSLGFRNGWALSDEYKDELLEKTFEIGVDSFPWLRGFLDRSVTEAEMLHGALNDPDRTPRVFFYFRGVGALRALPEEQRATYCDMDERAQTRLHSLKRRIVEAGFGVKFFDSPEEMADQLEYDFVECVNRDFPPEQMDTPLQREQKDHAAFADMRTQVFVGREEQLRALDRAVLDGRGAGGCVWLRAPSGAGKSALAANWLASLRSRGEVGARPGAPEWDRALVIERYVGATPASSSPVLLCRWIMAEVAAAHPDLDLEMPEQPAAIMEQFPSWLEAAARRAPVLLLLDGLDSLADESDRYLRWLPASFAPGVRVVCSAADGTVPAAELGSRAGWTAVDVPPLDDAECRVLISQFLGRYGKQIDAEQEAIILACPQTRTPLFLSAFLHEVRVFGVYEKVNTRIQYYMGAGSVSELFDKVVERLEEDFDGPAPGLVRLTLSYILASRQGISEHELRGALCAALGYDDGTGAASGPEADEQVQQQQQQQQHAGEHHKRHQTGEAGGERSSRDLGASSPHHVPHRPSLMRAGTPGARVRRPSDMSACSEAARAAGARLPFPVIEFSSLMLRLHDSLVDQRGLRAFSHEYMRQAVRKRYAASDVDRERALRSLADYWRAQPASDRRADEYPSLLHAMLETGRPSAPDELRRCLTDVAMFSRLNASRKFDLHRYWAALEARGMRDVGLQYSDSLQEHAKTGVPPAEFAGVCEQVAAFLVDTDRYRGAGVYLDQAIGARRLHQGERHPDLDFPLSKKAELVFKQGHYDEALPLYREALAVVEAAAAAGERPGSELRATVLRTSIAGVLKEQGRFEECLAEYRACVERQVQLVGRGSPVVAASLVNLAELHLRLDQPGEALPLYAEARETLERGYGPTHPLVAVVLSSQASTLAKAGQYDEALELYARALDIKETQFGREHVGAAVVLSNMAGTHAARGEHGEAARLYRRSLELSERAYGAASPLLSGVLARLGGALLSDGDAAGALGPLGRARALAEAAEGGAGDPEQLAVALCTLGEAHAQLERWEEAAEVGAALVRRLDAAGSEDATMRLALTNTATALQELDRCAEATELFARVAGLAGRAGDEVAEATALLNLGVLCLGEGDTDRAKASLGRAAEIRARVLGAGHAATAEANEWLEEARMDVEDLSASEASGLSASGMS